MTNARGKAKLIVPAIFPENLMRKVKGFSVYHFQYLERLFASWICVMIYHEPQSTYCFAFTDVAGLHQLSAVWSVVWWHIARERELIWR